MSLSMSVYISCDFFFVSLFMCLFVCFVLFQFICFYFIFVFRFPFVFCNRGLEEKWIGVSEEVGSGQNWRRDK